MEAQEEAHSILGSSRRSVNPQADIRHLTLRWRFASWIFVAMGRWFMNVLQVAPGHRALRWRPPREQGF